jgi:kumamolisin
MQISNAFTWGDSRSAQLASWLLIGLAIASPAVAAPPAGASATDRVTFTDSISQVAAIRPLLAPERSASLVRSELTPAETAEKIEFSVGLRMRNLPELQARVSKGEIISFDEMAAKYYPTAADCKSIVDWLTSQGFAVKGLDKFNLSVFASGSVEQSQRAFGTKFSRVRFAGVESSSAMTAPSLPATLGHAVLGINGLQPHLHPKTHFQTASGQPQKLTNNQPPYMVKEIAGAYNAAGVGVNGAGQKIAIVIDTFPASSDLTQFWQANGIAQSLSNIEEVQAVAGPLPARTGEETLDVEWSSSIASGAKVRVYATTSLSFANIDQAYQTILNDLPSQPALHQVSLSFGLGEAYEALSQLQTDAQYFASMAASGVTVLVASGDGGSSPGTNGWEDNTGLVGVESPASDLSVTAVGGTSLYLSPATGAVSSEIAWAFGGGGRSQFVARPSWQTGAGLPAGPSRTVPDVAFVADLNTGGYLVFNGNGYVVGGTSWGAPSWAGFCAMLNQARGAVGQPSLGLLGPKLYPLNGTTNFRQITTGSNGPNGVYNAGPGYNLCTGLGTPNVAALIQALVPAYSTPAAPDITAFPSYSGDFNGDGKQDILWRNTQTGEVDIWFMSGASIASQALVGTVGLEWKIAGIADFNGDGVSDIVWQNTATGDFGIWIMHGSTYMGYEFASPGNQWSIAGIADLDHTGFADILWRNVESGELVVWKSGPGLTFSSSHLGAAGMDWALEGAADLFGNGQLALIFRSLSSGEVVAWQTSNNSVSAQASLGAVALDWTIAGTGDFSGNGRQDILWHSSADGSVVAWMMNGFEVSPAWISQGPMSQDWQISATPAVTGNGLNSILWSNDQTGEQILWTPGGAGFSQSVIGYSSQPWAVLQ